MAIENADFGNRKRKFVYNSAFTIAAYPVWGLYIRFTSTYLNCENQVSERKDNEERMERINEPRSEKTGLRGFRPGPTQTGLYKMAREDG